jgi:hypothetical protein
MLFSSSKMLLPKPQDLRHEISWILCVKLLVLAVLWYFCFSNPPAKHVTDAVFTNHLMGSMPAHLSRSS